MKSQVNAILLVVGGLLKDARLAYPTVVGLERDFERLSQLCRYRGLGTFSLDLPILADLLLEGLRTGRLPSTGNPFGWISKRVKVPRLFSGLWLRVFDKQSCLRHDADVDAIAFIYQLSVIAKKVRHDCSPHRKLETMKGYINVESQMRTPSLNWQGDQLFEREDCCESLSLAEAKVAHLPLFPELTSQDPGRVEFLLDRAQQVADLIVGSMLKFDPVIWSDILAEYEGISGLRHGTGAVAERIGADGKSVFKSWPRKLAYLFPYDNFGKCPNDTTVVPSYESPSQLHMAPKTLKGPRVIAAEPVAHQWCQGLVLNFLVFEFQRLFSGDFIDLKAQHKSGNMVLQASRDGSLATVDLSDASDRLSCYVVERVFRRNPALLRAFHAVRTRFVRLSKTKRNELLVFKKFASQGTGMTFPVQSVVFLVCAIAASSRGRITWNTIMKLRKTVRVYGDDIIIPVHGYDGLRILLETLGLKVNERKSFASGQFRESCGTDGFNGYNVTPCKPQVFSPDTPSDVIALVDESNNLFKKGYWNASVSLLSRVPNYALRRLRVTGPDVAGSFGIYSFVGGSEAHLDSRWNPDLQRRECRVFAIKSRTRRSQRDGYGRLVDLSTARYSPWNPRVVSEYVHNRYTKGGVYWEPSTKDGRIDPMDGPNPCRAGLLPKSTGFKVQA